MRLAKIRQLRLRIVLSGLEPGTLRLTLMGVYDFGTVAVPWPFTATSG
jgi:hypothetical protein